MKRPDFTPHILGQTNPNNGGNPTSILRSIRFL